MLNARATIGCAFLILNVTFVGRFAAGQPREFNPVPPPHLLTSAQQLQIEQIQELVDAGEAQEAIDNLQRLFDGAGGRLLQRGGLQAASTLRIKNYRPLQDWTQAELLKLLAESAELRNAFELGKGNRAESVFQQVKTSLELELASDSASRYLATIHGAKLSLLLADLQLERGWNLAAIQTISRMCPDLRRKVPGSSVDETLPWPLIIANLRDELAAAPGQMETLRSEMSTDLKRNVPNAESSEDLFFECLARMLTAATVSSDAMDSQGLSAWAKILLPLAPAGKKDRISTLVAVLEKRPAKQSELTGDRYETFAGSNSRKPHPGSFTSIHGDLSWSQLLERFTANRDVTDASQPRVGESASGTLFCFPVVAHGRVYINTLTGIEAFDLKRGRSWPSDRPGFRMFDSGSRFGTYLPVDYPLLGVPRGTLSLAEDCLYARLGNPATGWANGETAADGGSQSFIMGFDLRKQGIALKGFPLRLVPPQFSGVEFEGAPLVFGDWLIVALVSRDNVGVQRRVAAFDRFDGSLIWESPVIAAGSVQGSEQAHLISHQLLTEAGGRIFYNTNLGSIACIDPVNGQLVWQSEYERVAIEKLAEPIVDRYRYRDLTPCMVDSGLVYCAPQDCPEVFALDAITGDLVWSTDCYQAADVNQLIGIHEDSVILSGDRLLWLNRLTGRVQARFPMSTTPGRLSALPSPRGRGRGAVSGGRVFWPTAGEIFVFSASQMGASVGELPRSPRMLQRINLGTRGNEGGNVTIVDDLLILNTPSSMMIFQGRTSEN